MELEKLVKIDMDVTQEEINFIWERIREFNRISGPMQKYPQYESYNILLKDKDNKIVAGIITKMYLKSMFLEAFWVDQQYRKKGIGRELIKKIENHAKEKECKFIHLDTFSFQAIGFYEKLGYTTFGVIEDYPDDIKRYYLKKILKD